MPTNETLLNLNLSTAATPALTFVTANGPQQVPLATGNPGFQVLLEAALPYTSISIVLQTVLQGKRLTLTEGLLHQYVILQGATLYRNAQELLVAEVPFTGSFTGTLFVTGLPRYNPETKSLELLGVAYELETKNLFLKGAKWLFGNLILDEIKKHATIAVAPAYTALTKQLDAALNKTWTTGVAARGAVDELTITGVWAQADQLLLQAQCRGSLQVVINELELKL